MKAVTGPVGRPTKLSEDIQGRIVAAILRGAYIETAASLAGIDKVTFYDWLKKGQQLRAGDLPTIVPHDRNLIAFSNAVEKAIAESELRDIMVIDNAAQKGEWTAAAWKLERKHYQRWGRKVAITDHEGGNFFAGMAQAWVAALRGDDEPLKVIGTGELKKLNGHTDGSNG